VPPHAWEHMYSPKAETSVDDTRTEKNTKKDGGRIAGMGTIDTPAGKMTGHAGVTAT
jgi:hypothetical protein